MDNHAGFAGAGPWLEHLEKQLLQNSDLVIVSSDALEHHARPYNPRIVVIRNACEHSRFARPPGEVFQDKGGRRIIGYCGAIADWFDVTLVRAVAHRFPDHLILLLGSDTVGCGATLSDCSNVDCAGEVAYDLLPGYLHGMDVCLIPFLINELTIATNPVKVYEYLSAAKPVVSTDLPELRSRDLDRLIYRATSQYEFLQKVERALAESDSDPIRVERIQYSSRQTWEARTDALKNAIGRITDSRVSIVMVTHNGLELTKRCVNSIREDRGYANYELIVVDNASTDETPAYLEELAASSTNVRVVLNSSNRGFAAANNQGLAIASGDFLTLLNNDTIVTRGWIRTLVKHLARDTTIGIIGPVTNNIGNEARVSTRYVDPSRMPSEAYRLTRMKIGRIFDIPVVAFFCAMLPRSVYDALGPLDENYGIGFFEDDDYCERIRRAGRRVVCAEDVFIHHELSASFDQVHDARRRSLFERNRAYYESKWGPWKPHEYRKEASDPA
jgi:GT2 family glycosyltransferase